MYSQNNDSAGQIALTKAMLHVQVFRDEETGKDLLSAIETDYPGTNAAGAAKNILFRMSPEGKAETKQGSVTLVLTRFLVLSSILLQAA